MAERREAAKDGGDRSAKARCGYTQRNHPSGRVLGDETRQPAEQDASQIVAEAYQEAARIIAEAKEKAKYIAGEAGDRDIAAYGRLSELAKSGKLTEHSYEQIDELFIQIRRYLAKMAQSDQTTIDELTNLVVQVEYWVESLVVDSLKLKSLERWLQGTTELARRLRAKLDRK